MLACLRPRWTSRSRLAAGEVGYLLAGIKEIDGAPVGDTITLEKDPATGPLPGFRPVKPRVFAGLFPVQSEQFELFRDALQKLRLNDAALHYEPESSAALGFGFRCGFLGMLHMEIIQERLEREYGLNIISTAPTVVFEIETQKGLSNMWIIHLACRRLTKLRRFVSRTSGPTCYCRQTISVR